MRDAGRLAAAIEVLGQIEERHRPVRMALKNWGESARYAGAKDRAFVSGLVLDVLRRRRSLAWRMGAEGPRPEVLGALRFLWRWPLERIADAAGEEPHGPGPLTDAEMERRWRRPATWPRRPRRCGATIPTGLTPEMARAFGEARADERPAPGERAPVDLRVNTLKTDPERRAEGAGARCWPRRPGCWPRRCASPALGRRAARRAGGDHPAVLQGLVRGAGPRLADRGAVHGGRYRRASRCSTSAPAAAARPWRWLRRWGTRARSTPTTATPGAWPTPSAALTGPACATCRSARR